MREWHARESKCGSEMQGRGIEGTKKRGEKIVKDNLRKRNLGDEITKVSRKDIGVKSGKGIWERKVGEDGN